MGGIDRFMPLKQAALLVTLVLVSTLVGAQGKPAQGKPPQGKPAQAKVPLFAPDRILVKFRPGTASSDMNALARQAGAVSLKTIPGLDVHVLRIPAGTVAEKIAEYARNPNVVYAEPDYYRVLRIPTEGRDLTISADNLFNEQWALHNTGQPHTKPDPLLGVTVVTGAHDADGDVPEAWDITQGSSAVKIAILDTGVDCRSPGFPGGSLEFVSPGKCIEEVNFVAGYFSNYDGTPITVVDVVAHGSHVAGIAAAATDNGIGIAGVGWRSSIGSLKACFEYYYDQFPPFEVWAVVGICPVSSSAEAIMYAANKGYHVINMSYASDTVDENGNPLSLGGFTQTENDAVQQAWSKGVVLIAAAGNGNNTVRSYPAAYDKVIAVGATDRYDDRASFSTFSMDSDDWVSLLAPGDNIISTVPNALCVFYAELTGAFFDPNSDACLDWYSGTSMASPHVAGAAALVWGHLFPSGLATPATCVDANGVKCNQVVRQRLENGADAVGALGQNMRAWSKYGRLNVASALREAAPAPTPPAISLVTDNGNGTATVTWAYSGQVQLQREKWNARRNIWQSVTTVFAGTGTSYTDASGTGRFHYRVGAVLTGGALWGAWSEVVVTDSSTGGSKGGGKPK